MSRHAFFSSRSVKSIFFDVDTVVKKQIEMWFSVVCIDNEYASSQSSKCVHVSENCEEFRANNGVRLGEI